MSPRVSDVPEAVRMWAEIDLEAVRHNVRILLSLLKQGAALLAVVKSEAYGHGGVQVARAALEAGATRLGVNEIAEALALREAGIDVPVQLLTSCLPQELGAGIEADLTFAVSSTDEIAALAERTRALLQGARRGRRTKVHLMADTGMGRGGFGPDEIWPAVERVQAEKTLELEGLFTHFSSAEETDPEPTHQQIKLFRRLLAYCEERRIHFRLRHAANSAGTVFHPQTQLDLVRCGVLLHGLRAWPARRDRLELLPSLALYARIIHIGRRPAGWPVGYNRTHICRKDSLLATLPIGYGDGYRRALSGRSCVIARGLQVPVVGTVSMNCIVADITALEHSAAGLPEVGEPVALIGGPLENRITVEEIAEKSGTIPYVVTTQLGTHVLRRYIGERQPAARREQDFEMRPVDTVPAKTPLRIVPKEDHAARIASA
ncbi:MAG: alanine racemase [Planctomycetota bacterium]